MMPAFAKPRRKVQLERIEQLSKWAETCEFNRVERKSAAVGVVCAGATYQHVVEALPDASVFKLGVTYPLPAQALRKFEAGVDALYVVEEGSTYLTDAVRALGVRVADFPCGLPRDGELTPGLIRTAFVRKLPRMRRLLPTFRPPARVVRRLPASPGVQGAFTHQSRRHRRYRMLHAGRVAPAVRNGHMHRHGRLRFHVPWLRTRLGGHRASPRGRRYRRLHLRALRPLALISTVYNKGGGTVCVLDNRTTAMTGRQGNPFNGETLQHRPSRELDLESVLHAIACPMCALSTLTI